jgi:phosphoglycolate phosphatase-like HAD superfamily hydrolase
MNLAIFDVDGTLADTSPIDAQCYVRAVSDELGVDLTDAKWSDFTSVTDSGISVEIFQRYLDRTPSAAELVALQRRFRDLLAEAARRQPDAFTEVAGAAAVLRRLRAEAEWSIAIATGSWQACAAVKLRAAGLAIDGIPAAFADDGTAREAIITTVLARARTAYRREHFGRVVSIGDAPWDVQTARRLGLPFIGVCAHGDPSALHRQGASHVIRDFTDVDVLRRALVEARVPASAPGT